MTWADDMQSLADAVDAAFAESVTLRRITAGTYDASTGLRTNTLSDTTVRAIRGASKVIEAEGGGGNGGPQIEQVMYTIAADQIVFRPDREDLIIDGAFSRKIVRVEMSVDNELYEVTTERSLSSS